jgi:hypothetical protein
MRNESLFETKRPDNLEGSEAANDMSEDYQHFTNVCSMQIGTLTLPLKIDSIYYGDERWVYRVTSDTISEREYTGQKFIIKPCLHWASKEIDIYKRLSQLQGRLVPKYHGVGNFQHGETTVHAFMLGLANGVPLRDFTRDECSEGSEVERRIFEAYDELSRHCIVHGDVDDRHIFIDKARMTVMLLDFDLGEICDNEKSAAKQNRIDLDELFTKRRERLACSSNT